MPPAGKTQNGVLLRRCAVTGFLFQNAEATACYAAWAPLLSSRASQEEELADSISKNGSLSGIAELVSPITARKISRKHQYEYSTQIAINMNRLRRLVVSLGLLWFSTFFKNGHLKVHGFMDNNTQLNHTQAKY